jgi:hypothetical protein
MISRFVCVCLRLTLCPRVYLLNQLTDFCESQYELYATRYYHNLDFCNVIKWNYSMANARTFEVGTAIAPFNI